MASERKVLSLVSYKFYPPATGGQKNIAYFYRYLARELDLTCVSVNSNEAAPNESYQLLNVLGNHALRYVNPFYFFTLRRIIKEKGITDLLVEHPYYGWLAVLLKWSCKVNLLIHSHNIEGIRFRSIGKWWWGMLWNYERFIHRCADLSFFITEADRDYAIERYKLKPSKCSLATYGIEQQHAPAPTQKDGARKLISARHHIGVDEKILLFTGTLAYKPNQDALDIILYKINPALLSAGNVRYKILVCGAGLPPSYNGLSAYKDKNIIYAGFVADIDTYLQGSDIFINPVIDGGGIKTKIVEALGNDLSVVSTRSGAVGVPAAVSGNKLQVLDDNDWDGFTRELLTKNTGNHIPSEFFNQFYWGNIAKRAALAIRSI